MIVPLNKKQFANFYNPQAVFKRQGPFIMPQTIYHRSHSDIISKKISPAPQGTVIIGTKSLLSADKRDFVSCKEAAKKMPAKSYETDSNPQKVGSEQISVRTARLQVVSRCERDLLQKRRNSGAGY